MKRYKVINPFRLRDSEGKPKGLAELNHVVHLTDEEAARLIKAQCVTEIEAMTKTAPEDRILHLRRKRGPHVSQ